MTSARLSIAILALWGLLLHAWAAAIVAHFFGFPGAVVAALTPFLSWAAVIFFGVVKLKVVALFGLCVAFWLVCIGFAVSAAHHPRR